MKYQLPQPQSYSAETAALITQLKARIQLLEDRIKRLEELGNELRECASMIGTHYSNQIETIDQAEAAVEAWDKEVKP